MTTNGIITWTPDGAQVGMNYLFTTVVTDTNPWAVNAKSLSATNSFWVTVLAAVPPGGGPQTNVVPTNSLSWYAVSVPPHADRATNTLLFASAPVNLWYSTNLPPSITNAADVELLAHSTGGKQVLTLTSVPVLVPGSVYYLGVQNLNSVAVTEALQVTFHYVSPSVSDFTIVQTNLAGTNGFLLRWRSPTNEQFHLQWASTLRTPAWVNFKGVVSFLKFLTATNSEFEYFDDGTQTGGFEATRYYRLRWLDSPTNTAPDFVAAPSAIYYVSPLTTFVYTNTAQDWDVPAQTLDYSLTNSLTGGNLAVIDAAGVITWTPSWAQLGLRDVLTTTVTDDGVPAASVANAFAVVVTTNQVAPVFGKITAASTGVTFQWTAPTNEDFEIRWTTNLESSTWQFFPNTITSATTNFSFVDTNTPLSAMKFYQLILLP
jgi:hypothetical protein